MAINKKTNVPRLPAQIIQYLNHLDGRVTVLFRMLLGPIIYLRNIIIESSPLIGIQIGDKFGHDFGWRAMHGQIRLRGIVAFDPSWSQIGTSDFWGWKFSLLNKFVHIDFPVPHDCVKGTDVFINVHWLSDGTDTVDTVKWQWEISYAREQQVFDFYTPITVSAEQASNGQYVHMVAESVAINLPDLEPDSIIYARLLRVSNGGSDNSDGIFMLKSAVHYQSTNIGTKNKSPDFYT